MGNDGMLVEGFEFPTVTYAVGRAFQERKHRAAGVDPALFGHLADPTFLGHGALRAMDAAGLALVGQVHMTQRFRQTRRLRLDEPLTVSGRVVRIEQVPRGRRVHCGFEYRDADGDLVCETERSGLRPGPDAERPRGPGANADGAASGDAAPGFEEVAVHALTPEGVAAYSDDALNPIHNDPEVAARFGYRAPIAAGLMGIHYYMAHLAGDGVPSELDLSIRFRRPMFWDDRLRLFRASGRLCLVNDAGRMVSEAWVG